MNVNVDLLIKIYDMLFHEYNRSHDIYDRCDEKWDTDMIEFYEYELELFEDIIDKLERLIINRDPDVRVKPIPTLTLIKNEDE